MKRGRLLSTEELALWADVANRIRPLPGRAPPVRPTPDASAAPAKAAEPHPPAALSPTRPHPRDSLKPLVPLERRLKQRLRRGQTDIEGVLDLHGLRQDEAHRALLTFIHRKHHDGAGVVLVITGKGGAPTTSDFGGQRPDRGVLRRLVPHWLADPGLRNLVLGYDNAAENQGGGGALYVRLRRKRTAN